MATRGVQLYDDVGNKVGPPWKVDETERKKGTKKAPHNANRYARRHNHR